MAWSDTTAGRRMGRAAATSWIRARLAPGQVVVDDGIAGVPPAGDDAAGHAAGAARSAGDRTCERVTRRAAAPGVHDRAAWQFVDARADAYVRGGRKAGAVLAAHLAARAIVDHSLPVLTVSGLVFRRDAVRRRGSAVEDVVRCRVQRDRELRRPLGRGRCRSDRSSRDRGHEDRPRAECEEPERSHARTPASRTVRRIEHASRFLPVTAGCVLMLPPVLDGPRSPDSEMSDDATGARAGEASARIARLSCEPLRWARGYAEFPSRLCSRP